MAYYNASLADIINALASAQEEVPQRMSYPRRQAYTRPQAASYFNPQEEDDDDESSDGGYYSLRYPDYYAPYLAQQSYRPRGAYRRQQIPPQQPQQQPSQGLDLNDILSMLTGQVPQEQIPQRQSPQTPQQQKPAESQKQVPASHQSEKPSSAPAAKSAVPQSSQPEEHDSAPASAASKAQTQPQPLHRHSTANFKEPKPKIEISQRNAKNPTLPYSPQTNIYESEKDYTVILAIPGATLSNLDIDFHPSSNEIVVKGTIPEPFPVDQGMKINEIRTGSVERRIKFPTLPKIVDEQIKAKYANGLLTIRIPKTDEKELKPKRKVTIEEVPDEELLYEEHGGVVA